ncbi:nitronate monooxygenase [Bacillus tianshenii]|nr:nitronate monooxygenase [Bacillus tianshenii]
MEKNQLVEKLGVNYPIIQAPMAGGMTTSELVAAVSNAGGLGNIGAGYMSADAIREQIRDVKKLTDKPFGINLFIAETPEVIDQEVETVFEYMKPLRDELNMQENVPKIDVASKFEQQLQVLLDEGIAVCSFTFGLPPKEAVDQLKEQGTYVIGTATTVEEAIQVERLGLDAVVVQGSEAGGHRGNFLRSTSESLVGLMSLVPQVADAVSIPVIAAGGIMDGRGVSAALCLGAKGAQLGTAFLTCKESGAKPVHKQAILEAEEVEPVLTTAFSGKHARGIQNRFITYMEDFAGNVPPYPIQNTLTKGIRKESGSQSNKEYMSLWSGQSPRLAKDVTASELIAEIMKEVEKIIK